MFKDLTKEKLEIKDLISIGIYSAIYFLFVTIATLITAILIPGLSYVLIPAIAGLLSGSAYLLLVLKVKKYGAITIMGLLMAIFYFSSGHFPLAFIPSVICAILADLIAFKGKYLNNIYLLISYIIFSFVNSGPILPLYFTKDAYIENLVARGKDSVYIDKIFSQISIMTFIIFLFGTIIMAILGYIFAKRMMKKHFIKAGIV